MNQNLQKKLVIFDVDNTIINWSEPSTIWTHRRHWSSRTSLSNTARLFRGIHHPNITAIKTERATHVKIVWFEQCVRWIQQTQGHVAIFSDLPQLHLHQYFTNIGVFSIIDGLDIGCVKPLPDGGHQLMAQFGVPPSQTYLIGDDTRTDGRSAFNWGGHFIPVSRIQKSPLSELQRWLGS